MRLNLSHLIVEVTDLLKEYRRLDDTIIVRLNRTNAQFRDRDREGKGKGNVQDEACIYLWKSLVGMLRPFFCVFVI